MEKNDRFPLLSSIARIFWLMGSALFGVGVIAVLAGAAISVIARQQHERAAPWLIVMGGGVVLLLAGLWLTASAERIAVLFAIEKNTRGGAEWFGARESKLPTFPSGGEDGDA